MSFNFKQKQGKNVTVDLSKTFCTNTEINSSHKGNRLINSQKPLICFIKGASGIKSSRISKCKVTVHMSSTRDLPFQFPLLLFILQMFSTALEDSFQ